jgi:F-type H+-transporting ATPase subunit delta
MMSELITIARPYAKAVFEFALEHKTINEWERALKKLAIIGGSKIIQPVLTNPLLPREQLANLVIEVAGDSLNDENKRLVKELAGRRRLNLLPAIEKLYDQYLSEYERTVEVKVVSAYPLDNSRLQRLQYALQNKLKRKITMHCLVDRDLLGGVVIYAGDQVIDDSLRSKLKKLSERLCS